MSRITLTSMNPNPQGWAEGVATLDDFNATYLLELSAVFSALDATKGEFWAALSAPAFAGLHGVSWQLFTRLTLESQAQTTHLAKPSAGFMAEYLVKNLHKFMAPSPEYLEFLKTTDLRGVNGFTGTLWQHQVGLDGRQVSQNTNRMYALLHHYPTLHRDAWQAQHQQGFCHLPDFFCELTGASVPTLLLACEALYTNYVRFFNENLHFNPPWLQAYWRVPACPRKVGHRFPSRISNST